MNNNGKLARMESGGEGHEKKTMVIRQTRKAAHWQRGRARSVRCGQRRRIVKEVTWDTARWARRGINKNNNINNTNASAQTGGHGEEYKIRGLRVAPGSEGGDMWVAPGSGGQGGGETNNTRETKNKRASAPTEQVCRSNEMRKRKKESDVPGPTRSVQSPLMAIYMGALVGLPAELRKLTGQYRNRGLNVDDIDGLAAAMCASVDDDHMEEYVNAILCERVMKSNPTGEPVEPFKSGN